MKFELNGIQKTLENDEELKDYLSELGEANNWSKYEIVKGATLDDLPVLILGTSQINDLSFDSEAHNALNALINTFSLPKLDIDEVGYGTGALPVLRDAMIAALSTLYNMQILYVWDTY